MPDTFFVPKDQISFVANTINQMFSDKRFEKAERLSEEKDGKKVYLLIENKNDGVALSYYTKE